MTTLHRVSYIDHKSFLNHEWFPTMFTANDRVNELVVLGMESVDFEEVQVPWDHIGDLIHWLNHTPNSPNLKDDAMSNNATYWTTPIPTADDVSPAFATPIPTAPAVDTREYTGGSVSYYQVRVDNPTTSGSEPYTAECNDIIEALGMNYAEGNAFKAIWRICAARQGKAKRGYDDAQYDSEKIVFFGQRLVAQNRKE